MLFRYIFNIKMRNKLTLSLHLRRCWEFTGGAVALDLVLELVTGVKGHYPTGLNGDGFTGTRVATGPRRLGADLKISKAGYFHIITLYQAV